MRKLPLVIFVTFLTTLCFSQETDNTPLTYENVVHLDSTLSKDDLFTRGEYWVISVFKNPQKVIQLKDKEGGQIISKGVMDYSQSKWAWGGSGTTKGIIRFTVKLFFKDGRYKFVFTDFIHEASTGRDFGLITNEETCSCKMPTSTKKWKRLIWNDIKSTINNTIEPLIASLLTQMKTPSEVEGDKW